MGGGGARGLPFSVLGFAVGSYFIFYFVQTLLGIVEPAISVEMHLSIAEAPWIFNSYMLAVALFVAIGGKFSDRHGYKPALLGGLLVSAAGSVIVALAPDFGILLAGLAVTGLGAAPLAPASVALAANSVSDERRGLAIGIWGCGGSSAFLIVPLMGGFLVDTIGWRSAFWCAAGIALALVFLGARYTENLHLPPKNRKFAPASVASLLVSLAAILVAVVQSAAWGWGSLPTLALLIGGCAGLAVYVLLELKSRTPLLNLRLLQIPAFLGGTVNLFTLQFAIAGFAIYVPLYLQHVLGFGPFGAAVALLAGSALFPISTVAGGRLCDHYGARNVAIVASTLFVLSFVLFGFLTLERSYPALVPALVVCGIGATAALTGCVVITTNAVAPEDRAQANAVILELRWVGAALAVAALGSISGMVRVARLTADFKEAGISLTRVSTAAALPSHDAAYLAEHADRLGQGAALMIKEAAAAGFSEAFFATAGVGAVGLAFLFVFGRPKRRSSAAT